MVELVAAGDEASNTDTDRDAVTVDLRSHATNGRRISTEA
jgi:hypothetical protein